MAATVCVRRQRGDTTVAVTLTRVIKLPLVIVLVEAAEDGRVGRGGRVVLQRAQARVGVVGRVLLARRHALGEIEEGRRVPDGRGDCGVVVIVLKLAMV